MGGGGGGGGGGGVGFAKGGRENDRCCIPLNMKMNKYLHQLSFAVMLCSN